MSAKCTFITPINKFNVSDTPALAELTFHFLNWSKKAIIFGSSTRENEFYTLAINDGFPDLL